MEQNNKYYAFISYKREDERWAAWLQHKLEHYKLPANLNGRTDLPKEIRPVFRDTSELNPGNLPQQIHDALEASQYLIVICSPRSARSEWVDKEIETFIAMGKQEKIIPFIVDGRAMSSDPEEECFPPAIRNLPAEKELLGANITEMGRDAAAVKTVAQMFGVRFDTLWGRYEREQKRRRNWIIAAVAAFVLAVMGVAAYIWRQADLLKETVSRAAAKEAMQLIEEGDAYTARRVALAALDMSYTPEAEAALRQAWQCRSAVLRGHTGTVYEASFSPDGKRIFSKSRDNTLRIWDVHTGKCLETKNYGEYECFSPDGKYKLSGSDSTLSLWDDSGQCLWSKKASDAFFSPDGHSIVSMSEDSTVCIWSIPDGSCLKKIQLPFLSRFIKISPDGKYLACFVDANYDDDTDFIICLVETASGKVLHTMIEPNIGALEFSPDSRMLALDSRVIDVATGKCLYEMNDGSTCAAFSHDGKYLAVGTGSRHLVYIMDAATGEILRTLNGHTNYICSVAFSPDGKNLVSASDDKTIRIWHLESSAYTVQKDFVTDDTLVSVIPSPDYKYIAGLFWWFDSVCIWDVTTGKTLNNYGLSSIPSFSSDGRYIAAISGDTAFRTYDVATGECLMVFKGYSDYHIAFSPDNRYIVSGNSDSTIHIWDAATGECLKSLNADYIYDLSYSPDGQQIASTSPDSNGTVRLWDAATGQCLLTIKNIGSFAFGPVFSSDGKKLLIHTLNYSILIYDAITGSLLQTLEGHTDRITDAAFSPDGNYVVSSSEDKTVRIWEISTGHCLQKIAWDSAYRLFALSFTPDGRQFRFLRFDRIIPEGKGSKISICTWDFLPLQELKDQTRERFRNNPLTPEERRRYYLE